MCEANGRGGMAFKGLEGLFLEGNSPLFPSKLPSVGSTTSLAINQPAYGRLGPETLAHKVQNRFSAGWIDQPNEPSSMTGLWFKQDSFEYYVLDLLVRHSTRLFLNR